VGGVAYFVWRKLIHKAGIDDPLDAVAVHLGAGLWGTFTPPLFSTGAGCESIFYHNSKLAWDTLGWNLAGVCAVLLWAGSCSLTVFGGLAYFGRLRMSDNDMYFGVDKSAHGCSAYVFEGIDLKQGQGKSVVQLGRENVVSRSAMTATRSRNGESSTRRRKHNSSKKDGHHRRREHHKADHESGRGGGGGGSGRDAGAGVGVGASSATDVAIPMLDINQNLNLNRSNLATLATPTGGAHHQTTEAITPVRPSLVLDNTPGGFIHPGRQEDEV
jgi:hypothetical protein